MSVNAIPYGGNNVDPGDPFFKDSQFRVYGSSDATKKIAVEVDAQTTGKTLTINTGAQTVDRTLTVPVLGGSDTIATLAVANVFTGQMSVSGAGTAVGTAASIRLESNTGPSGTATQNGALCAFTTQGACTTMRGIAVTETTDNTTHTITSLVGMYVGAGTKGAADTVTNAASFHSRKQTVGATSNIGFHYSDTTGITASAGTYAWYNNGSDAEYHGTAINTFDGTTDATSGTTGTVIVTGGVGIAKTLIAAKGQGRGVTNTVTHNGATTLVQASTMFQNFTGTTAGEIPTMPAANLWGAGIAVVYCIVNSSNQTITPTRAGSDTFQGGGTTDPILAGAKQWYASDGVSVWLKV